MTKLTPQGGAPGERSADASSAPHEARLSGGWRPIKSAPKDGTRVLVYFDGAGEIVAFRDPRAPDQYVRYLGFGKSAYWPGIHADYALYWQPLPDAPGERSSRPPKAGSGRSPDPEVNNG